MNKPQPVTKTVTQYQTKDGFVFDDLSKAQAHEGKTYWKDYLKKLKREILEFEVTQSHCKAIKELRIDWYVYDEDYYFFPVSFGLDDKRPFGNSYSLGDLAEIMELKVNDDEGLTDEQEEQIKHFFCDLSICLKILIDNLSLSVGKYIKKDAYSEWVRLNE